MWRLWYFIPIWVGWYLLIELPLTLLGFAVVWYYGGAMSVYRAASNYYFSEDGKPRQILRWRAPWWVENLFGNEEDGVDGLPLVLTTEVLEGRQAWWQRETLEWTVFRRIWMWSAFRNSVSNLRFTCLGMSIEPDRVRALLFPSGGWLAWQGLRGRIHWEFKGRVLEVGWKVRPDDAEGLKPEDSRFPGVGFGARLKKMTT